MWRWDKEAKMMIYRHLVAIRFSVLAHFGLRHRIRKGAVGMVHLYKTLRCRSGVTLGLTTRGRKERFDFQAVCVPGLHCLCTPAAYAW